VVNFRECHLLLLQTQAWADWLGLFSAYPPSKHVVGVSARWDLDLARLEVSEEFNDLRALFWSLNLLVDGFLVRKLLDFFVLALNRLIQI
jgi:hypothetical protein